MSSPRLEPPSGRVGSDLDGEATWRATFIGAAIGRRLARDDRWWYLVLGVILAVLLGLAYEQHRQWELHQVEILKREREWRDHLKEYHRNPQPEESEDVSTVHERSD